MLAARGARRVAVEDPSADDDARLVAAALGLDVSASRSAPDGILVEELERTDADVVVLTPVAPVAHRRRPVGRPRGPGSSAGRSVAAPLIVEDDYDAEYRYDRAPIGAMQGLAPDRVVYAGTASKTLAPGLRLGLAVCPVAPGRRRRGGQGTRPIAARPSSTSWPSPTSSPVANSTGTCAACARSTAAAATHCWPRCAHACPNCEPVGVAAGQHVVTWLPQDLDEAPGRGCRRQARTGRARRHAGTD